jgi:hypothetical protein
MALPSLACILRAMRRFIVPQRKSAYVIE